MKHKYLLYIGLFIWFGMTTILSFSGLDENLLEVIPVIGLCFILSYFIKKEESTEIRGRDNRIYLADYLLKSKGGK